MSIRADLEPQLPYLRRYARALTGSQALGDACVHKALAALLAEPAEFVSGRLPKQELFRVFHKLWAGPPDAVNAEGMIVGLAMPARQALLLTAIEEFSIAETAQILDSSVEEVAADIATARQAIADSLVSRVMIIEDEAIIALHLKSIVEDLGHAVAGIARTRTEAYELATSSQPELVLADISLADGSSGIDAVKDILGTMDVPVVFITAFPERLLTGERPEPAYLITKPFSPATVTAIIGQALFFHREALLLASTPARLSLDADAPDPRKHFDTPEALLADTALSDDEKKALLSQWNSDIDDRLNAESEGMGISDPLSARKEGRLADEAGHVKTALTELETTLKDQT